MAINEPRINKVVVDLVRTAITGLPEDLLSRTAVSSPLDADRDYRLASALLQEARQLRDDLILHAGTHVKIYGQAAYEEVCRTNRSKIEALEEQTAALETVIHAPNIAQLTLLLRRVHELGFETFWNAASASEKRTMISMIVARIVMVELTIKVVEQVVVEQQSWLAEYVILPESIDLPYRMKFS